MNRNGSERELGAFELIAFVAGHIDLSSPIRSLFALTMILGFVAATFSAVWAVQGQMTCGKFNPGAPEDYGANFGCLLRTLSNLAKPGNFEPSSRRRVENLADPKE